MNKNIIIGLIAVLVLGGGGAAYLATQKDDTSDSSTSESSSEHSDSDDHSAGETFNPKITADMAFVATISGTSDGVESLAGTIESDGKGNTHFSGTQAGETAEYFVLADGSYIFCQDGTCYKTPTASGEEPDDYNFRQEDIDKFKATAVHLGEEDCPAGKCDVWQVNDDGTDTKIYISKSNQYVSQVIGTQDGDTFKIVYDFKDVTVTPPTDVQDISNFGQ